MNLTEQQLDLVDRYLRNEFEEADQQEWDLMMSHPNIKDEIFNILHIQKAIKLEGRDALKEQIASWDNEKSETGKIKSLRIWPLAAAASVLLILAFGIMLLRPGTNDKDLFAAHFELYPNVVAPIKKGETDLDQFSRAFQLYENRSYTEATAQFDVLDQNDPDVLFYSGLNLMAQDEFEKSASSFKEIAGDSGHKYFKQSQWYLAWCHYKKGEMILAREIIEGISRQKDHPFSNQASEVLKDFQ